MRGKFRIKEFFLDRRPNSPQWCACRYDPESRQTRRSSLGTSDFQEAQIRLAEFVTKHRQISHADPSDIPLETFLVRYWEGHAKFLPSAEQAQIALRVWSEEFAGLLVSELTYVRQEQFIALLRARGLTPSYISRIMSVGRAALRWAWKRGELKSVPFVLDVSRDPEKEAERFPPLEREELVRLLEAAARVPHLLRFCVVALTTMARPGAILGLRTSQIDLATRTI